MTIRIITWDWRDQIPLDELEEAIHALCPEMGIHEANTGADQYGIILDNQRLSAPAAQVAYEQWDADR